MTEPFEPFKDFDPLLGEVPNDTFSNLDDIACRARWLLVDLSSGDISVLIYNLNIEIEEYFFRVKYEAVRALESDYGYKIVRDKHNRPDPAYDKDKFVPVARRIQGSQEWDFIENYELDIPIREEYSEVDVLKAIQNSRKYSNVESYKVFAALSLWMLANAIDFQINNFQALNQKIRLKRQNFPAFFA
jgi:hypothetical protein